MAKFRRTIIFLAMLSACHLSHASVIVATAATTAAISASAASEQEQRTAINASANTTTVAVTQDKPNIGFVTCGKRYGETVGSLGCAVCMTNEQKFRGNHGLVTFLAKRYPPAMK